MTGTLTCLLALQIRKHLVIAMFLTMLIGAGGNTGAQSVARIIQAFSAGNYEAKSDVMWSEFPDPQLASLALRSSLSSQADGGLLQGPSDDSFPSPCGWLSF